MAATFQQAAVAPTITRLEVPENGLAGLKHWRHDLIAGLIVSLISLPFSLGIAVASGAPPICGITSAIIAGFVLPFLGGSYVTISGPAAGLAPILLASMAVLGRGNLENGYPLLLATICVVGVCQIGLAKFKLARFSTIFPAAVVEGMLAAIGLLIIVKQFPFLLGVQFEAHEFFEYLAELPRQLPNTNPLVFVVGVTCLTMIFALNAMRARWLKIVPPQVLAVAFGTLLATTLALDGGYLIHLPDNPLQHGLTLPDFAGLWNDSTLWLAAITTVVTLTMIDGIESLATMMAIDKIDPFHRKSDPNRTLLAMGVSNICSSLAGGLTIIPGGVKSTACIVGGGRTQWANFYNACFLLIYLLLARSIINLIPYSALAAVLIFTGYKLCEPRVWRHVARIGWEQLAVFTITVVATLATDLLWGITAGIAAKWILATWLHLAAPAPGAATDFAGNGKGARQGNLLQQPSLLWKSLELFRSPVVHCESIDDEHRIFFRGPLVCFNLLHINRELSRTPRGAKCIKLHLTENVTIVDHTSCERLLHFAQECERNAGAKVEFIGLEQMNRQSEFPSCLRMRRRSTAAFSGGSFRKEHESMIETAFAAPPQSDLSRWAPFTSAAGNRLSDLACLGQMDVVGFDDECPTLPGKRTAKARADLDWLSLRSHESSGELDRRPG